MKLEGTDVTLTNPTQQNADRGYLRHRVTLEGLTLISAVQAFEDAVGVKILW